MASERGREKAGCDICRSHLSWGYVSQFRIIAASSPDLILRSIAQAMRLEGWPRAMAVQAAILRDARLRCASPGSSG